MKGTSILSSKWDKRFMQMAKFVSTWSKDPSTQVGSIAVRNRTVIAQGYNGFPRGINDTTTRLDNRTEKYKFMVHAEMNVIYNAAENGVSLKDSTVYVYGLPVCSECAKGLIQAGIKRIVTPYQSVPENWKVSTTASQSMFGEVGIRWDWLNF